MSATPQPELHTLSTEKGPVQVRVRQAGLYCASCKGPTFFVALVTSTGYSAGSEGDHAPDCKANQCDHGVSDDSTEACPKCEEENYCPHGIPLDGVDFCEECDPGVEPDSEDEDA